MTPRGKRLALLLAGVLAAGGLGWYFWPRTPAPEPPEVDLPSGSEPALVEAIQEARRKVRQAPHSPDAWSHLASLLLGNSFATEAAVAFAQTERLLPDDPRWPYLHAECLT